MQHRGGAGANMAYGMGLLGLAPVLVGAVGSDFADYEAWLSRHGVDTGSVRWSELKHTAPRHRSPSTGAATGRPSAVTVATENGWTPRSSAAT